jgi:stage II sporulation protein P
VVRITAIKININYIKMIFTVLIFLIFFIILSQSRVFFNPVSLIHSIDAGLLKKAISTTAVLNNGQEDETIDINIDKKFSDAFFYLSGFRLDKPETIVDAQIPSIHNYSEMYVSFASQQENLSLNEENRADEIEQEQNEKEKNNEQNAVKPKESLTREKNVVLINETNYKIDLKSIIDSKLKIEQKPKSPQILIYHTHSCEAYTPSKTFNFTPTDTDRTEDTRFNVIKVGDELTRILSKQYGYNVIHDKTIHDAKSYNSAYTKSLKTIEGYVKKYPSIGLIIDVHRDASNSGGKKLRVATKVGKSYASNVMVVIGSDARGVPHPNWRENLKLGVKFIQKLNTMYPGMGRGVNLKEGRFNQFLSKNSIIMEVGGNGNTLDEALESTKYISQAVNELLKEAK